MRDLTYPTDRQRNGYFARYAKALFASDALRDHGAEVIALVLFIASEEDRLHYSKAPRYWRKEIMYRFAWNSQKKYAETVKLAETVGLLHVDRATKGSKEATVFWTLTPQWLEPWLTVPNGTTTIKPSTSRSETSPQQAKPNFTGAGKRAGTST
jgi:hypothetical protein